MKKGEPGLGSADEVLHKIEEVAKKDFLPIIGPNRGSILSGEVRKVKPQRVLEIGTLIGYSTILIGKELGKTAEVASIEIHGDEVRLAKENIVKAKLKPKGHHNNGRCHKSDSEKTKYLQYLCLAENKLGNHRCGFCG